jgi:hypothetical protein
VKRAGALEHGRRDVDTGGLAHDLCEGTHDVTRPAGDVEHHVPGPRAAPLDDEPKRGFVLDVRRHRERRGLARELVEDEVMVFGGGGALRRADIGALRLLHVSSLTSASACSR